MVRKWANTFLLETENAFDYAKLIILEKIHVGAILFEASVYDKKISTQESIRKGKSKIQERTKGQHFTKNNEKDRKHALDTYVEKKNEKKSFSKDGVDHYDQELKHTFGTEYEYETEKAIPDENSTFGENLISQSNENKCAARNDEQQAIPKTENTSSSEHLQTEEQLSESCFNDAITSSVDENNDSLLEGDGCGHKEDQGSLMSVKLLATLAEETNKKQEISKPLSGLPQTEKLSVKETFSLLDQINNSILQDDGCKNKGDQGSAVPQTNSLTPVKLLANQKLLYTCISIYKEIKEILLLLPQKNDSFLEAGGSENKEDQNSAVKKTAKKIYEQEILEGITQLLLQKEKRSFESASKYYISLYVDLNYNYFLEAGDCENKDDQYLDVFKDYFNDSAEIQRTFYKKYFVGNKAYLPKKNFVSVERRNMKRLDNKSERRDDLLRDISHQEFSANNATFEPYPQTATKVNENQLEYVAQGHEIDKDEELFFILEQDEDEAAIQDLDKKERNIFRLNVVTAEVFENALRQYQIENYEITHTNYFPRNCRMFLHIPVLKGGFINRQDLKDRR